MLLKMFYDDRLAQASYMVGCPGAGEAIIIDPARDITPYLEIAEKEGLQIVGVTETHIHADFVSGIHELAAATGATVYLSDMGNKDWQYDFPNDRMTVSMLNEGDTIEIGNVKLTTMHTPGHTPEHISFVLTDAAVTEEPMAIFTGDFLFVGNVGRPDLLEASAGMVGTAETGAKQQFATINRFKQLPEYLQILPGHGAGSACGKGIGSVPSTTLGYEQRFNPAFQIDDEAEFVAWLLDGQPEAPPYFARMKRVNRVSASLLLELPQAQHITEAPADFLPDDAMLIDTRPAHIFAHKHLSGSVNIPISSNGFSTWAGNLVADDQAVFFIAYPNDVMTVLTALYSVGIDNVPGYFTADILEQGETVSIPEIKPEAAGDEAIIVDVRGAGEYESEHIPDALNIPMPQLRRRIDELSRDTTILFQCQSGVRSQVVASFLMSQGFTNVATMPGGINAWRAASLPIEES